MHVVIVCLCNETQCFLQNTVNVGQGRALVASESQMSSAIPFRQNLKTATGCVSFLTHPKHPELCQPSIAWVCVYVCVANMPWHVWEYALLTWPKITLPKLLLLAKKSLQGIRSARTASSGFPFRGFPEFPGEAECSDSIFLRTQEGKHVRSSTASSWRVHRGYGWRPIFYTHFIPHNSHCGWKSVVANQPGILCVLKRSFLRTVGLFSVSQLGSFIPEPLHSHCQTHHGPHNHNNMLNTQPNTLTCMYPIINNYMTPIIGN